jgi:hypothetical protein
MPCSGCVYEGSPHSPESSGLVERVLKTDLCATGYPTVKMEREIESLRKRLEFLEQQKRKEEEKERKKETIEYNLKIIQDAATNMKEQGEQARIKKYHPELGIVCRAYAPAFEAIYNSLRLINEQLNPPKTNEINTTVIKL